MILLDYQILRQEPGGGDGFTEVQIFASEVCLCVWGGGGGGDCGFQPS